MFSVTICHWPLNQNLCCARGGLPSSICSESPISCGGQPAEGRKHRCVINSESIGALMSRASAQQQSETNSLFPWKAAHFQQCMMWGRLPAALLLDWPLLEQSGFSTPWNVYVNACISLFPPSTLWVRGAVSKYHCVGCKAPSVPRPGGRVLSLHWGALWAPLAFRCSQLREPAVGVGTSSLSALLSWGWNNCSRWNKYAYSRSLIFKWKIFVHHLVLKTKPEN